MRSYRRTAVFALALAFALAATASCASGSGAQTRSDAEIARAVRAEIAADPSLNPFAVTVDTRDGVVTLSGHVLAADDRVRAERLARGVVGVRGVVNLLEVGGP
jgi:osmotically-inducible protein OsmY